MKIDNNKFSTKAFQFNAIVSQIWWVSLTASREVFLFKTFLQIFYTTNHYFLLKIYFSITACPPPRILKKNCSANRKERLVYKIFFRLKKTVHGNHCFRYRHLIFRSSCRESADRNSAFTVSHELQKYVHSVSNWQWFYILKAVYKSQSCTLS